MRFSEKIINLRVAYNISQEQLAQATGVSKSIVDSWESGKSIPDPITISRICEIFEVTNEYLIDNPERDKQNINDIYAIRQQVKDRKVPHSINVRRMMRSFIIILVLPAVLIFIYQFVRSTDIVDLAKELLSEANIVVETNKDDRSQTVLTVETKPKPIENTQPPQDNSLKKAEFFWSDGKSNWTYSASIPTRFYDAYRSVDRTSIVGYSLYVTDSNDDEWIGGIVQKFKAEGKKSGYSNDDIVKLMITFVQSLKYEKDIDFTGYDEYPKFPLETLYDGAGDCEDTCILLASLIREFGYGTVLIIFEDHMGIGIKGEPGSAGSYFEYNNIPYYYIETTGEDWEIGEIPEGYENEKATIVPVV